MGEEESAEAVRVGPTSRQRAEPVSEDHDVFSACLVRMPRKRALKPEETDSIRWIRLGAQRIAGIDVTKGLN